MRIRKTLNTTLAALCLALPVAASAQQAYPSQPIRMVVAFAPGGSADINARAVGQQLSKALGTTIVVENKGGAGGNIGAADVARATPDGYTLFYATSAVVLSPALYASPGFDPYQDFTPIALTATIPLVLVASPKVPATSVQALIDWGKSKQGMVNYGSSGAGALLHLAGGLFLKETGWQATHVPYKGSAPAITDLLGGSTDFMFLPINEALPHIKGGGLNALAITSESRSPLLPDVPTLREATGKTTMDMGAWQGLMAPKGAPEDVVATLSAALQDTLADPGLRERLTAQGSIMLGGTPQEYLDYMQAEGTRWTAVIKDTGVKVN